MDLVLFQPSIPPNTGNIGRLCVGMQTILHIIGPCNFDFSDAALKRAGLDYWEHLDWQLHSTTGDFLVWLGERQPWLITKFGDQPIHKAAFKSDDVIIMGNEQSGLPASWHNRWPEKRLTIPMAEGIRSYNLANSAAMALSIAQMRAGMWS